MIVFMKPLKSEDLFRSLYFMIHTVNKAVLERGRGVKNGVVSTRMGIKRDVIEAIHNCLINREKDNISVVLNKIADDYSQKSLPGAIHNVRASIGLDPLPSSPLTQVEVEEALFANKTVKDPIVTVVPEMCEKCPDDIVVVSDLCMKCRSHPCDVVCPVGAVHVDPTRKNITVIDPSVCIRCEKCIQVCPYTAILHKYRPCKAACGVEAITIEKDGVSKIQTKDCVSCGLCTVACPFGAIIHKSEVGNVITKLSNPRRKKHLAAIVAPAFINQFTTSASPGDVFDAIKKCGFDSVIEVAFGADLDTVEIAEKLKNKEEGDYIGTSCCPSWVRTVKTKAPSQMKHIVPSYAPMVECAHALKQMNPELEVVFVGPCIAKISETLDAHLKGLVEHAITFEEMQAIFDALNVKIGKTGKKLNQASSYGRGYACAGGVASAVVSCAEKKFGLKNVKSYSAGTLAECRRMLQGLEDGSIKVDVVEGMGCPGGCVGGAGTIAPIHKTASKVKAFVKQATLSLDKACNQKFEDLLK